MCVHVSADMFSTRLLIFCAANSLLAICLVNVFNGSYAGNVHHISRRSQDTQLPEIEISDVILYRDDEDDGNSVLLSWNKPREYNNITWVYGIFYGVNEEEMLAYPRDETTNTSILIKNLDYCQKYMFTVVIVGPAGVGPISNNYCFVNVPLDVKATPEKLNVEYEPGEIPKILVQWSASCPVVLEPVGYNVMIHETETAELTIARITETSDAELQCRLNAMFGAVYDIKVATNVYGAMYTPVVTFQVPYYLQPYKVKVTRAVNDTFIVYWREPHVPQTIDHYKYEVLVSPGNDLNETSAEAYRVIKPIFVYEGKNENEYMFGVKLISSMGYNSLVAKAEYVENSEN